VRLRLRFKEYALAEQRGSGVWAVLKTTLSCTVNFFTYRDLTLTCQQFSELGIRWEVSGGSDGGKWLKFV